MADNITITHGDKNGNSDYTASLLSTPLFTDFEIQCKPEPCSSVHNPTDEDSAFDEPSTFHIPISIPMIKNPIVLLERCDKIWETLQLIKIVQTEKPIIDDKEENKEEVEYSKEAKQSVSHVTNQSASKSHSTVPLPFKFSVQKTKKLYPCNVCGKQYLERRSLRKHSERVHGITLPLLNKRGRVKNIAQLSKKKDFDKVNPVTNFDSLNNENNLHAKTKFVNTKTISRRSAVLKKFVKCTLCQQQVLSIRKHLIDYHKIGGSSSVVEQLESSLLIENGASSKDKKAISSSENISSKNSSQFAKMDMQDGFRIMDNEVDTSKTSQVKRKRKYKFSYVNAKKRLKLNNERYILTRHESAVTQKQASLNHTNRTSYQCDICLGVYASPRSLYKHRRNHIFRGETKENFHNVKCRYHNSPFNKKNKLLHEKLLSSVSTRTTNNNSKHETFNQNGTVSKINKAIRYNREMDKSNNTTCICGRSFRNPHTLFIHKQSCELSKQEDMSEHTSVNSDSGIGLNITIKKLNNSYEIVGKDNNEDKQKSGIHFKENNLSISNTSDFITKESVNLSARQKESDKSELSNYSRDHSFLKLHVAEDEDAIIDVEDDVQIEFDINTSNKMVTQQDDKIYMSKENNDMENLKNEQVSNEICTLKQMCQNVLVHKSENAVENENQENSQIEDQKLHQEDSQIKSQKNKIHQENKRKLRSSNKQRRNEEKKLDNFNDGMEVCMMQFDPLSVCAYCNEQFETVNSYYNHQCTVKEGRSFDEFSLQLLCFYCKDVLHNFNEYDKHTRVKHFDKAYHCYLCTERFVNAKARFQHINLEHNNMSCRFCNERISIKVKALHEGYHLGFGYPCHKCKKAYTNEKNLAYHNYKSRLHPKTDNLVNCSICLKSVKRRSIRTHMSTHKHNACYFCGKVFSNKTGIEFHTMIHHGTQSKLKCNVCGTRFFTKQQLEKHAKVDGCDNGIQGLKNRSTAVHH
ncbi:uncharacterized protein [Anoplolepis gracilipes]|uniref:uncharacterized protein n=1 Tax=Anoplolepis gracilipes TaxID=354296 RepID=UPI003BA0DB4D